MVNLSFGYLQRQNYKKRESHLMKSENGYPGARFSKVPIINGPGKLSPFTLKIEVSIVLHLAR